jgi:hypothetical protein
MNTSNTNSPWIPYTIPPTPNVSAKFWGGTLVPPDPYVLSPNTDAVPSKNPSQFLEWSQLPINDILAKIELILEKIETIETKIETIETKIETIETKIETIENRLDSATIEAECDNGDIVVTLNL